MKQQAILKKQLKLQNAPQCITRNSLSVRASNERPSTRLHQTIGNHGVLRYQRPVIQTKLKIGSPGERYEREADKAAEQVMRMPEPAVQLQQGREELSQTKPVAGQITPLVQRQVERKWKPKEEEMIYPKAASGQTPTVTSETDAQIKGLQGSGRPLPGSTRAFFESCFGCDLSQVRVHQDSLAAQSALAVGAKAYTMGTDIVFGAGQYTPKTRAGQHLLAHELAHVVQQHKANTAASRAMNDQQASITSTGNPPAIQRQQASSSPLLQMRPRPPVVSRAEAQIALTKYLQRARKAQKNLSIRVTPPVRGTLEKLVNAPDPRYRGKRRDPNRAARLTALRAWLESGNLPGEPTDFARQVARWLPDTVDAKLVAELKHKPVTEKESRATRIRKLVESTAPGEPQPVGSPSRFKKDQKEDPDVHTATVPIGRAVRVARGLGKAWADSPSRRPQAQTYPQVEKAIQQLIRPEALVPPKAIKRVRQAWKAYELTRVEDEPLRLSELEGERERARHYADAQKVARYLARELDLAQQRGYPMVSLPLNDIYNQMQVSERRAFNSKLGRIVRIVRDRLPHRASRVKYIEVCFGKKQINQIRLAPDK